MSNVSSLKVPPYRLHKPSGRAVVTIEGRQVYLGKYDTAVSRENYRRTVAEYLERGGRSNDQQFITVAEVMAAYIRHARSYYV